MRKKNHNVSFLTALSVSSICMSLATVAVVYSWQRSPPVLGISDDTRSVKSAKAFVIPFGYSYLERPTAEWTDVPGMQITLDSGLYPSTKQVTFETTVFCPTGNQTVWVRLRNQEYFTYPEVVMNGKGPTLLTSSSFSLSGNKQYTVQIKTQLGYPVHIYQARMNIRG